MLRRKDEAHSASLYPWAGRGVKQSSEKIEEFALGAAGYPARLADRLGTKAPKRLFVSGAAERLEAPQCAIVGSREAPQVFLKRTHALALALSETGIAVTSGMARGIDAAAHRGALAGSASTVVCPPMGVSTALGKLPFPADAERCTLLSAAPPDAPFHTRFALARNDMIAALGDVLVFACGGLKGGSSYALRWALQNGVPVFTFDSGARTPPGNRSILRSHGGNALACKGSPEQWARQIAAEIKVQRKKPTARPATQLELAL